MAKSWTTKFGTHITQVLWILKILHDPKYLIHWELWYYSILMSCRIFNITQVSPQGLTYLKHLSRNPFEPQILLVHVIIAVRSSYSFLSCCHIRIFTLCMCSGPLGGLAACKHGWRPEVYTLLTLPSKTPGKTEDHWAGDCESSS